MNCSDRRGRGPHPKRKPCTVCGVRVTGRRTHGRRPVYCSRSCALVAIALRTRKAPNPCLVCGTPISWRRGYTPRICSPACLRIRLRNTRPNTGTGIVRATCQRCGVTFARSRRSRTAFKFCSRACSGKPPMCRVRMRNCINCGTALVGQQRLFCSSYCSFHVRDRVRGAWTGLDLDEQREMIDAASRLSKVRDLIQQLRTGGESKC